MKLELQDQLFKKYPKIFHQKDLPMSETCMCWGLECGDGWYDVIDDLCDSIQTYIDCVTSYKDGKELRPEQVAFIQVKEKFGGLRVYCTHETERIDGMIFVAETIADKTCEECGSRKNVSKTKGWITTLCADCMVTIDSKRKGYTREKEM